MSRPAEVTRPVLERYQRRLFHRRKPDGTPLSNRSQYGRLLPIRGLFRFLVRHNRILSNPASTLRGWYRITQCARLWRASSGL